MQYYNQRAKLGTHFENNNFFKKQRRLVLLFPRKKNHIITVYSDVTFFTSAENIMETEK